MSEEVKVRFTGNTSSLDKSFKGVGRSMKMLTGFVGGFAIIQGVRALSSAFKGLIESASSFSRGMAEVNTIARFSTFKFKAMKREIKLLSSDIGLDLKDSVKGLYQALSAGVPKENVMEFLKIAGKAAVAGVTDLNTAVDGLTSVMNAYGIEQKNINRAADTFFEAIRLGKTTFPELAESIGQVAPIANTMGISFEETAAALTTMTKSGIKTTEAVTQLKGIMTAMLKPTESMKSILSALEDIYGKSEFAAFSFQEKLKLLTSAVGNDENEITKLIPKVRGLNGMFVLTGENASEAASDLNEITNGAGAAQKAFDSMEKDDPSRAFDKMSAAIKSASTALGNLLLPGLADLAVKLKDVILDIETVFGTDQIAKDIEVQIKLDEINARREKMKMDKIFKEGSDALKDEGQTGFKDKPKKDEESVGLDANDLQSLVEIRKQRDADNKAADKAALAEEKALEKKAALESKMMEDLQHRIEVQKLINAGKEDEAKLAQMVYDWEKRTGEELDENSIAMNQFKEIIALDKEVDKEKTDLGKTDSSVDTTALERIGAVFGTSQKEDKKELKSIEKFTSKTSKTLEKILEKENNVSLGAV